MNTWNGYFRPDKLETGSTYLLRDGGLNLAKPTMVSVKFVSYTACPAIIVVSNVGGFNVRCLRDDLFVPCQPNARGEIAIDVHPDILETTT